MLVRGFEALACSVPPAFDALLEALRTVAAERAARGQPFYATFVDPGACLPLGPLYNWHRQSQPTRSNTKSLPRGVTP
ncbi:MAG: hypothetical protein M5U08_16890 [Burkholderiales bacterium]|nr:hypothetical protein [Burkholderiales bacterium]